MQSVTVAERQGGSADRAGVNGGSVMNQAGLPELSFVRPIPGFTDLRRFVLVRLDAPGAGEVPAGSSAPAPPDPVDGLDPILDPTEAEESPLYELRSLEQPDVRFMVAVPGAYFADYEIELDDHECGDLGLSEPGDALVLVMLTVGADAAATTANLLAPVVINARTRTAAQVILTGSDWPVRAPLG